VLAHELLDVVPAIIQSIRVEMRTQRQHDLSVPQFRTLAFLSRHPGSSLSAAAEFIGLTLPTMSVLVEGLVQRGLVDRAADLRDRRRVLLSLTPEGGALHQRVLAAAEAWLEQLLAPVDTTDRATILHALHLLRPLFAGTPVPATVGRE
jgi:DNA-binding MarR family transcriptional regulator